ncbi:MAG: spore germination protein [Clostridia bacterium]|nr:spore germination protein [Clostridia bacterium]
MDLSFTQDFERDVHTIDGLLRINESYDLKKREIKTGGTRAVIYYAEGFQDNRLMTDFISDLQNGKNIGDGRPGAAQRFICKSTVIAESSSVYCFDDIVLNVLSGKTVVVSEGFPKEAVVVDVRKYPVRTTSEPENDRVMRGARDGFVEAVMLNVTLIRRRIRDPGLTVSYHCVGNRSKTDLAVIYLDGKADPEYVRKIVNKINSIETDSLTLGHQSLTETLIRKKWYNPFPKIRATERPDAASASILEGSIVILCDNSPEALILPTSVFDFLQVTDDYYFPPLTGSYLRVLRHVIFILTVYLIPVWYLLLRHYDIVPEWLLFVIPSKPGNLPILLQIILVEFAIDGLKLASLNTPDMLSGSLSIVGGLLLGDFAVQVGWLSPDVILYMAFVAIANFTQTSFELGYAFKYLRMLTLILTVLFDVWGFVIALLLTIILLALNNTDASGRGYLYPIIPPGKRSFLRLMFRMKKDD